MASLVSLAEGAADEPTGTRSRDLFLPLPPVVWRVVAAGYVLLEAVLGAIAFSSDADHPKVEVEAFLLALPMVVVTIPVVYVVGAIAWNVRDALPGRSDVAGDADLHRALRRDGASQRGGRLARLVATTPRSLIRAGLSRRSTAKSRTRCETLRVSEPVVDVRGLHVRFGEVEAVAGIDLQAYAGQATALLGRNGAGKSTTMRVLAGVVPPTAGTVTVAGPRHPHRHPHVKQLTGYCPDVGGLVPRATPWEHLQLSARLRRLTDWEDRARDLLERFELGDVMNRVTGGFSHGMGRRLSVVLAAMHEPQVLLLDEPFDGVDPIGVEATFDVIADARARGATILLSTHLRDLAIQACGTVLVMRGGSRVAAVDAEEMAGEEGARAYRALLD